MFEDRALRKTVGCKTEEVVGNWRRLHNEELHILYTAPNITRVIKWGMRWVGHVERMGEMRNACSILVRKPEGKRPLQRPRHR
jgi:hypothetical protein